MAIQMRRGVYSDFDPTKMVAGEWAIVTGGDPNTATGRAVYHCFAAGTVERVATYVDAREIVFNSLAEIEEELNAAVEAANDAAEAAGDAASAASDAASAASDAADAAQAIVDYNVPLMSASQKGGAKLGDGLTVSNEILAVDELTTTQIDSVVADTTVTSPKVLTGTRLTYLWGKLKDKFASLVGGAVAVAQGGTGKTTHTSNAVLTGNGTSAVNNVSTASGALYATAANGAASFGTLPVAQGGTGATSAANARSNLDAAQSGGASNTLYAAEQAIVGLAAAQGSVPSGKTLQGQISTLQDSVACGYVSVSHDGGDEKITQVAFTHEFSAVPYVVAVLRNGWYRKHLAVGTVTKTYFELITQLDAGDSGTVRADYIAMGRL